jgi:MarR family transcriptional regulator, transcriptional regulator for hemolysin
MDRLRNFGFLLKDVSRLSARNFERHVGEVKLGLTLAQCKVLTYLQRNEGITQVRLAFLSDTDPMTLVRILDRMESDQWIERRLDPLDRRARRLYLKPAAMPVLKQIWQVADRARAEALAGLDTTERNHVLDLLERIRGNLAPLVPGTAESERRQANARSQVGGRVIGDVIGAPGRGARRVPPRRRSSS